MVLQIKALSLGYGSTVVLKAIDLEVHKQQLIALMGPSGTGKSSLLRTIARWNDSQPTFWARGKALLGELDCLSTPSATTVQQRMPMLAQKARLYSSTVLANTIAGTVDVLPVELDQQKHLAFQVLSPLGLWDSYEPLLEQPVLDLSLADHKKLILARSLVHQPVCLLVDEPLRDISIAEEAGMIELIQRVAERCAVIMVTHNKVEAKAICNTVCLISGDRLIETSDAKTFFQQPRTTLGQAFLHSGSSWPIDNTDNIDETESNSAQPSPRQHKRLPGEFHWIIEQQLAGMQKPGLFGHETEELQGLAELGVQTLVNLTEQPLFTAELSALNLSIIHFPIVDMSIPVLSEAMQLCQLISEQLDQGHSFALHCKAGLGRTGTMLACVLVYRGMVAMNAIDRLRMINRLYIQTDEQLDFVSRFECYIQNQANSNLMKMEG